MNSQTEAELIARPVLEFTSQELAQAMNRSFEEYFVPFNFDAASFERRFRSEHLDPAASRLWFRGDQLVGVVYLARRGWTCRVAGMGLVKEARSQGYGRTMLQTAIEEATMRGDREMMLEVFTENEPARRLYERLGFRNTRHLLSFRRMPAPISNMTALSELDPLTVARLVTTEGEPDLPWMFSAETLAAAAPPARAFHLAHSAYAVVRPEAERSLLLTLVVPRGLRRQGWATRMLQALEAEFPGVPLVASLVPEGSVREVLRAAGWEQQPLSLYEMVRPLG
ncbi:GNAT family N-acetyltransferase [Microvirga sp. STR05]|uniref:GNAT family N-acetyltransferase n=1 Tax=Hymenobacter duratus TaxID=2771356 RepID=A0ABR8JQ79_9BACT|nr:GNAT family N-acetyltransferase [Hymenobacter duratus]MBD2716954.1 GNAT family N-acetyltransferase [Hymenobacter duratus]MBR7951870.1 GNAT family N-acetyltransferase [Microvirga sp. STR05]